MTLERIAYVLNTFPKLSEAFIANELAEVQRRGIALRVLALRQSDEATRHGLVERVGLDRLVGYDEAEFAAELEQFRPQIIHGHFARQATAKARDLAATLGVPYSFTAHGYDIYRKPSTDFRARADAAAAVVTVSEANADYIAGTFGVPRHRIDVIPCGVDTEYFSPGGTKLKRDPPHIVCVARLKPVKNHALLLEACALVRKRGVCFHCVLVGDGSARDEVAAAHARSGLGGWVTLYGAADQEEVRDWLRRASICALASDSEGMPVSLMEAAACGVAQVATAVGGVPELIEHGRTGLIVPPRNASALANALEQLLRDPARCRRYGDAARERALARYSLGRQVDRLIGVWDRAIGPAH